MLGLFLDALCRGTVVSGTFVGARVVGSLSALGSLSLSLRRGSRLGLLRRPGGRGLARFRRLSAREGLVLRLRGGGEVQLPSADLRSARLVLASRGGARLRAWLRAGLGARRTDGGGRGGVLFGGCKVHGFVLLIVHTKTSRVWLRG